ncbi:rodlin [Streptomyces flavidovirens]
MLLRARVTALSAAAAGLLAATSPTAVAAPPAKAVAPVGEVRIGLIAESTARCLGMPDKAPLKGIPGLTTFTINDLTRMRAPGHDKCVKQIIETPANPVNELIKKLLASKTSAPAPGGQTPRSAGTERAPEIGPQLGLLQETLNKACVGLPEKVNVQNIVALVNVGVQDINVLSNPQHQQCIEKQTQNGEDPMAHILDEIPILVGNPSNGS